MADPTPEALPDRLSVNPEEPTMATKPAGARSIGICFKGAEKTNVEEYCISEGSLSPRRCPELRKDTYRGDHADHEAPGAGSGRAAGILLMAPSPLREKVSA